eukprot:5666513-Lingulodinium_polyedra.AAC.1
MPPLHTCTGTWVAKPGPGGAKVDTVLVGACHVKVCPPMLSANRALSIARARSWASSPFSVLCHRKRMPKATKELRQYSCCTSLGSVASGSALRLFTKCSFGRPRKPTAQ